MNEHEFSQKVMVYSSKFYGYSYKILGDKEEARDVVQDLYIKLWSKRHDLKQINSIEAFATTIIRNLCIDRLKKIKVTIQHAENYVKLTSDEVIYQEDEGDELVSKVNLIRNAIKLLPEIQQKVFIMRDFEEKEFEEISFELGLTSENIRVILSRARKRVRKLIEALK